MKQKKVLREVAMPELEDILNTIPKDSEIFVDKSMQIADYIAVLLEVKGLKQKDLAIKMGKTEAEVSKLLGGMHNYTLRSISKLEAALGIDIIRVPVAKKFLTSSLEFNITTTYVAVSKRETELKPRMNFENGKILSMYQYNSQQVNRPYECAI